MPFEFGDMALVPFGFASDPEAYDEWFRLKVQQVLDDQRPAVPHEQVEAHFAKRRAAALRKSPQN